MMVLVTGGAGFIGSHLVDRLVRDGHAVRVLDKFRTGRRENLSHLEGHFELIQGDIRDPTCVKRAVAGVEVVFHLAAAGSVSFSVEQPLVSNDINVVGTLNVLVCSREAGVRRVVFSSSSSVYGNTPVLPKHEAMPPNPQSPYAITKLVGELYCRNFYQLYGLETVSLRYFNVFGPRQDPNSPYAAVVPKFISGLLQGRPPLIHGDGTQSRDFTYVENVVSANVLAAWATRGVGEVFNIGCHRSVTLLELYREVERLVGTQVEPVFGPPRPGDIKDSLADITRAKELLGYQPSIDWREGLRRTVAWHLNGRKALGDY